MAARVFLLSVLFTVGILTCRSSAGLEVGLGFASEPSDAVVTRNKPFLLKCSPSTLNTTVSWTLDHTLVNNDTRRIIFNNGSLYFKKVLHRKSGQGITDLGAYRCLIRNSYGGLVSRPARVALAAIAHEFAESPANLTVLHGDPVRLQCHIESTPPPIITWERDSVPLPQNHRYVTLSSGVLLINNADPSDEGEYRCVGTNEVFSKVRVRHSSGGWLRVHARPESSSELEFLSPTDVVRRVVQGGTVSLDCAVRGHNPEVTWAHTLLNQSKEIVSEGMKGMNVLTLHNVTEQHAGPYSCVALQSNKKQALSITKVVSLEVLSPPVLVVKPKSQVYPTAKTVRFECEAKGNPLPDITWLKDGIKLRINGNTSLRHQELVLSNTVTDDSGIYQCVANNSVGTVWAAGRLFVNASRDQPSPPINPHCLALSASTVHVSWDQPADTDIKAYTVHYLPTDGGEEMRKVAVNKTFTVEKLLPFTNYTFYVRAYSTKSASDQSEKVVCITGEGVPTGAPTVSVKSGPTSLRVTWIPLNIKVSQGYISEYKVQWRRKNHPSINVDTVKGDVTQYLITGLLPNKKYEVRVLGATDQGWPDIPDEQLPWVLTETSSLKLDTPLLSQPVLQLVVINATTIQAKWNLEPVSKQLDGFRLSYRKQNGEMIGPIALLPNATEYILYKLEPQTWYEVLISGVSNNVEGQVGVRSIQTLPPLSTGNLVPAIPPPTNLLAEPTTPTTINLTWTTPPPPTNVSYYTLSYHIVQTSLPLDNSSVNFIRSTSSGVQISGLKPYTLYELKVRTHDHNNRHSEYSQKLECRTLEDVPGMVEDVQWKPLNSSTVRISWKEPSKINGLITEFSVAYTTDFALPLTSWKQTNVPGHKYSAVLVELFANTRYFLTVWATTGAGPGPPTPITTLTIPSVNSAGSIHHTSTPPPDNRFSPGPDQFLGIIVGCTIGGCCIALCMALLVYRRRCAKPGPTCHTGQQSVANGNAGYFVQPSSTNFTEMHEMECFQGHLDTKGGYPNGQVNGLKLPLLSNGRIPNGHVSRDWDRGRDRSVRITENPQFNSPIGNLSPGSCEGTRVASDEGDSLLSGHQEADCEGEADVEGDESLNETQITLAHADCCHSKTSDDHDNVADDDGFHENETHRHFISVGPNG
ncbi:protogenin-like [Lycorma delicatula]|uniref:protogenin-like n=1 Tax=Lycorma delicatula TaxID=130591 RepID=UPI003F513E4F